MTDQAHHTGTNQDEIIRRLHDVINRLHTRVNELHRLANAAESLRQAYLNVQVAHRYGPQWELTARCKLNQCSAEYHARRAECGLT